MKKKHLIGPFTQLLTMNNLPLKGKLLDSQMEIVENSGIMIEGDSIIEIRDFKSLEEEALKGGYTIEYIKGEQVLLPGFVDCHTHICFDGTRSMDYGMRLEGKTYLEISQSGGGIWNTVTKTRQATQEKLVENTVSRADSLLRQGVTTAEVKSGYGLSVAEELKILRAIKKASTMTKLGIVPTCLAAHILPKDFEGTQDDYLDLILRELLPQVKAEKLSDRVDIFIEQSAFGVESSRKYLTSAKAMGFDITVHADQFTAGSSRIAIELGALSADHLESSTREEIALFKDSDCVAVALPGASIGLGMQYAPARKLLDNGACLAIGSDWNPGSAPMGLLLVQACILGVYEKMTIAETLAAITFRAAKALNINAGILKYGNMADMVSFPTHSFKEIIYKQGGLTPSAVWKKGEKVAG